MEDALLRVVAEYEGRPFPRTPRLVGKWLSGRLRHEASEQAVYCAELLAITYTRMGLLDARTPANWFDPGTVLERRPARAARGRRAGCGGRGQLGGTAGVKRNSFSALPRWILYCVSAGRSASSFFATPMQSGHVVSLCG